ncbi:putative oxidoreductase [compost metagenome]
MLRFLKSGAIMDTCLLKILDPPVGRRGMENPMAPLTLITGASSGIGKVFAERFAREKHDLIVAARRRNELEALAESLSRAHGIQVHVIPCDLSLPDASRTLYEEIQQRGLEVDGLVNNAGFGIHGSYAEMEPEALERMITVNVTVITLLTRYFLPGMIARRSGTIINIASTAAFQPIPFFSAYAASKAYVLSLTEGLAEEVRDHGIQVVALCPGPTRTEFMGTAGLQLGGIKYADAAFMDATDVVEACMRALSRREVVRIPGTLNALMARSMPFLPRRLVAKVSGKLMKQSQR